MKLYLVRHGQTELNVSRVYYGSTDCGLTSKGIEQARVVQSLLGNKSFDQVFSSDLKRASHTAQIIVGQAQKIHYDQRLREMSFGDCEGLTYEEILQQFPNYANGMRNNWANVKAPNGGCYSETFAHAKIFIEELKKDHKEETVLVVSHQGFIRAMLANALGMDIHGTWHFDLEQGTYSLIEFHEDATVLRKLNIGGEDTR